MTEWMQHAACRGVAPSVFHPKDGVGVFQARMHCATCPVAEQCLDHALTHGELYGVWGGMSERQRADIRRGHTLARVAERKPRRPAPGKGGRAVFTPEQADEIRRAIAGGEPMAMVAHRYHTTQSTLYRVLNRQGAYADRVTEEAR